LEQALGSRQGYRGKGVQVAAIVQDNSPDKLVYDPSHPDADPQGYVHLPNINIVTEMVDLITATRSYEANVTVLNAGKAMAMKALEIGRG
jgi:flagellar basal-body rod protein FlgC